MKVRQLDNAPAGIEVFDVDLQTASSETILELGRLAVENLILVVRKQQLSAIREAEICEIMGSVEKVTGDRLQFCPLDDNRLPIDSILQVTGRRGSDGRPLGIFGHDSDLDWHANRASSEDQRKPLVWLYSVSGAMGSKTSWANCAVAYGDLDGETKIELENLKGIFGFEPGRYTPATNFSSHRNNDGIAMVQTIRATGRKGLYFPFLQLFGFKDRSEEYSRALIQRLRDHVLQPQYVYHHHWADGDVVISEQWLTIHKRWACDVSQRMLHRITMGYENVQF